MESATDQINSQIRLSSKFFFHLIKKVNRFTVLVARFTEQKRYIRRTDVRQLLSRGAVWGFAEGIAFEFRTVAGTSGRLSTCPR
jgi:hypothetical protein